ncbi:MAG: hypothetical protein JKY11_03310 [Alphaproteobacteria bacterium]|nr:hypothetical protein [Alphaproteobacteria bacterium]
MQKTKLSIAIHAAILGLEHQTLSYSTNATGHYRSVPCSGHAEYLKNIAQAPMQQALKHN